MSPTDTATGLLEDRGESVEVFWSLLELNPFAVQFRYELAGDAFPDFEQFAQLTKELLAHVRSLLAAWRDTGEG